MFAFHNSSEGIGFRVVGTHEGFGGAALTLGRARAQTGYEDLLGSSIYPTSGFSQPNSRVARCEGNLPSTQGRTTRSC